MSPLFGRGLATSAVPVPRDDHPEPYDRKSLELVGSAVFANLTAKMLQKPQESPSFDQLLKEFDTDPQERSRRRRGTAVGTGVPVQDVLTYVVPAVAWVLGVVGERVAGRAADKLTEAVRGKAAVLLGRLRRRESEPLGESGLALHPRAAWSADERASFVSGFQIVFVQRLGLGAGAAEVLAEAIATALDDPVQGGS
ncbi:hypothetical protein ACIRU8_28710 [Streptomyces sp. NPDC101175]|uniref:hypothetical protein n=1 Tax=Streptomyces sp. NPDC101175 TaxID=3366123 RepID=UPI00383690EA